TNRTNRATPINRVRATGRVPRGFSPVTAAMTPIATARPSQKIQLIESPRFHPLHALLDLRPHRPGRRRMVPPPVAGQDPLEAEVEQSLHRADLLGPGEPARVAKRDEAPSPLRPGEMVAGEEELLAVEEHGVA